MAQGEKKPRSMSQSTQEDLGPIPLADEVKPQVPQTKTRVHAHFVAARLPVWLSPDAGMRRAWLAIVILLLITAGFGYAVINWSGGAHQGVDQAGYHMMGRLLADEHVAGIVPKNPWQFVSRMCIVTEDGHVFAKYPPGYPALIAVGRWFASDAGAYLVNQVATILACFMSYFLFRTVVSRLTALLGVIWLMCNPLTLIYAQDANSHATTLMCVVVGFWGLLSWWQHGGAWRALLGGLALGYACTIRYSEALLVLPVLFVALANFRLRKKNIIGCLALIAGWAIPVGLLSLFCWYHFGLPWKSGYTYCNEDTGFSLHYFLGDTSYFKTPNWESLLTQLNRTGLFLIWPLSLAGLLGLLARSWRVGITLALWIVPSTTLYLFYYWAPTQETNTGYLRFFISVIPGLILTGLWMSERAMLAILHTKSAGLVIGTVFGVLSAAFGMYLLWPEDPHAAETWRDIAMTWWPVALIGVAAAVLIIGTWCYERDLGGPRGGPAVALGLLTLIGCGFNLYDTVDRLENQQVNQLSLHNLRNELKEKVPAGSVIFADDSTCNYLDSVGGWQLYSMSLFSPSTFTQMKNIVDRIDRGETDFFNPDPVQPERARAYMELLGDRPRGAVLRPKTLSQLQDNLRKLVADAWAKNERVYYIKRESLNTDMLLQFRGNENKTRLLTNNCDLALSAKDFDGKAVRSGIVTNMLAVVDPAEKRDRGRPMTRRNQFQSQPQASTYLVIYEIQQVVKPKPAATQNKSAATKAAAPAK